MKKVAYGALLLAWAVLLSIAESGAGVVVTEGRIRQAVEDYVRQALVDFSGEIQVDVRRFGDFPVAGTGRADVVVRPGQDRSNSRSIPVFVDIVRGPAVVQSFPVTAVVRYFDDVVVAARPIERGESLQSEAVTIERREVTTLLGRYLRDPGALQGKQARMGIGFGRVIDARYAESIPLVNRGDQVQIRVAVGGIQAVAHGVATQSGAAGDRILVQNTASREKLLAEVVAPGVVKVAME